MMESRARNSQEAKLRLKRYFRIESEGGFVLVLALMLLAIFTLLGTLSLQIANTEILTAGNKESSLASFYLMEGVAGLGIAHLENQNAAGDECAEETNEDCPVKELYQVETTSLAWLDESYSGDSAIPVFDLSINEAAIENDDSVMPRIRKFPENWHGAGQHVVRVPEALRVENRTGLEPPGYVDKEDGGDDLIRFAVQDTGRIGAYSIGADDPVYKNYKVYGLYHVINDGASGYQGLFGVEMGYRMELARMEVL